MLVDTSSWPLCLPCVSFIPALGAYNFEYILCVLRTYVRISIEDLTQLLLYKDYEAMQPHIDYSHDLADGKYSYLFFTFFDLRVGILAHGKLKNQKKPTSNTKL